jgi:hypothetical protein
MSVQSTEPLLRELAQELQPVRPIPRLRSVAAGVLLIWLLALFADWMFGGPSPRFAEAELWREPAFLLVLAGLLCTAVGATLAALAGAVPGREGEARIGIAVGIGGLALATASGVWAVAGKGAGTELPALATSLDCVSRATALGIAPALVACAFLARALVRTPRAGAAAAAVGCAALGAVAVHASCPYGGALHVLLGHSFAPFFAALVLAFPLAALVRRWSRRGGLSTSA